MSIISITGLWNGKLWKLSHDYGKLWKIMDNIMDIMEGFLHFEKKIVGRFHWMLESLLSTHNGKRAKAWQGGINGRH